MLNLLRARRAALAGARTPHREKRNWSPLAKDQAGTLQSAASQWSCRRLTSTAPPRSGASEGSRLWRPDFTSCWGRRVDVPGERAGWSEPQQPCQAGRPVATLEKEMARLYRRRRN